jgi:hypothetical protein
MGDFSTVKGGSTAERYAAKDHRAAKNTRKAVGNHRSHSPGDGVRMPRAERADVSARRGVGGTQQVDGGEGVGGFG